jgi:hypothetical protein
LVDFIDAFGEPEVQRVLRAYENCITVDVHCSAEGDWTTERIAKEPFARSCKVRVNPDDRLTAGGTPIGNFSELQPGGRRILVAYIFRVNASGEAYDGGIAQSG